MKSNVVKSSVAAFLLTALGWFSAPASAAGDPFGQMDVPEVAKHLNDPTFHVYDANSDKVYAEGHVPHAIHLTFEDVTADKLPQDKQSTLLFYCKNTMCQASHEAAKRASGLGYKHVYIMPKGIDGWKAAGQPVASETKKPGKTPSTSG
jgi:rhodanese-related sulfurtransferase